MISGKLELHKRGAIAHRERTYGTGKRITLVNFAADGVGCVSRDGRTVKAIFG